MVVISASLPAAVPAHHIPRLASDPEHEVVAGLTGFAAATRRTAVRITVALFTAVAPTADPPTGRIKTHPRCQYDQETRAPYLGCY
jgi:hypothetical protein